MTREESRRWTGDDREGNGLNEVFIVKFVKNKYFGNICKIYSLNPVLLVPPVILLVNPVTIND